MKTKLLITASIIGLLILLLFSKAFTSKKIFSPDKQYSVYSQTYVYSELLSVFSYMDCWHHGKIFLYDEKEEKIIESVFTDVTETYQSVNWFTNYVSFKNIGIELPNDFWDLPRAIVQKKD